MAINNTPSINSGNTTERWNKLCDTIRNEISPGTEVITFKSLREKLDKVPIYFRPIIKWFIKENQLSIVHLNVPNNYFKMVCCRVSFHGGNRVEISTENRLVMIDVYMGTGIPKNISGIRHDYSKYTDYVCFVGNAEYIRYIRNNSKDNKIRSITTHEYLQSANKYACRLEPTHERIMNIQNPFFLRDLPRISKNSYPAVRAIAFVNEIILFDGKMFLVVN